MGSGSEQPGCDRGCPYIDLHDDTDSGHPCVSVSIATGRRALAARLGEATRLLSTHANQCYRLGGRTADQRLPANAMSTLYWLTDDLRLQDNPALMAAAQDNALTLVYCLDEQRFTSDRFGNRPIGAHRWQFICESLLDLESALEKRGQVLHLIEGNPGKVMFDLLSTEKFNRVIRSRQHGNDNSGIWATLQERFSTILFEAYDSATLYLEQTVQFNQKFPATFSNFRRALESKAFRESVQTPSGLPATIQLDLPALDLTETRVPGRSPVGGARSGEQSLANYFSTNAASTYKETRNQFFGENFSTGFSPWLAQGCLSPVQILLQLQQYELQQGANESTQWILFELLWREFFRWHAKHHEGTLFSFTGVTGQRPLTTFYSERFHRWRTGRTPWPIVNACMNQLTQTGLLSNRGRQIAASCLVNELNLDWRCGAGYFAEQLIDYDACSNWGNWQYIAGVGSDPRGGRHFNLEKQAETWDPQGIYREYWAGETVSGPLDSFDYYAWPTEVGKHDAP